MKADSHKFKPNIGEFFRVEAGKDGLVENGDSVGIVVCVDLFVDAGCRSLKSGEAPLKVVWMVKRWRLVVEVEVLTSQTQPQPIIPVAWAWKILLKLSQVPNSFSMAFTKKSGGGFDGLSVVYTFNIKD